MPKPIDSSMREPKCCPSLDWNGALVASSRLNTNYAFFAEAAQCKYGATRSASIALAFMPSLGVLRMDARARVLRSRAPCRLKSVSELSPRWTAMNSAISLRAKSIRRCWNVASICARSAPCTGYCVNAGRMASVALSAPLSAALCLAWWLKRPVKFGSGFAQSCPR